MKSLSFVETFFNGYDAITYLEGHLRDFYDDHKDKGWVIEQASINYMPGGSWRVGFVISRSQGELFND